MSADGKHTRGRTRNITGSARKRNRKEVLVNYNKARINKGYQHGRWMKLKDKLRDKLNESLYETNVIYHILLTMISVTLLNILQGNVFTNLFFILFSSFCPST